MHTPVIPEPERMREEECEYKALLGYIASLRPDPVFKRRRETELFQWHSGPSSSYQENFLVLIF